jgi:hypothetical protein
VKAITGFDSQAHRQKGDGKIFTNEFLWDETITTILDDKASHEDVQLLIDDNEVFIRQWNEHLDRYQVIAMSHQMFYEMLHALKTGEGVFALVQE